MARQFSDKRPKHLRRTLGRLLSYMGRHRLPLLAAAVLVAVSAGANLLGTYMIRPVVNHLVEGDRQALVQGVTLTACIYALGALSTLGYTRLMARAAQQVLFDIRRDLFAHLQTLPLCFFDTRRHGDVMNYFTGDVDTISDALNNSFSVLIQSFIQVVGTLTLLFILNWRLSLLVVLGYGAMFGYIRYSGGRSKAYYTAQQASLGELNGYIEEMVTGQKVVKVFNHEAQNLAGFETRNQALRQAGMGAQRYAATMVPAVVSISYGNYALVAVLGGLMALKGLADVGGLASYLVFVRQASMPINQFTTQSNFLLAALAGAERVFEAMDQPSETDQGQVRLERNAQGDGWDWVIPQGQRRPLQGDVRFEDVDFGYRAGQPILQGISLYAKPGQKIAFVGSTGAGKTTIINLINRFYEIQSGTITYDGIDIRRIKKDDLRKSLSMVIQDTHLFTGTIAENIRYGRLNATEDEVRAAAKIANADSFIRRLPKGYDTILHSDGSNLSQGQRQLLAIARAAISRPPVLILDEATSSIDTRTERLIEKGMDRLMENRTVFVIAHRLSTVRNSKAILVLEKGTIIERGDHEELLGQKGRYYQLYTGQFELE